MVWAKHVQTDDPELLELAKAPLKNPALVRYHLARNLRSGWPRKEILGCTSTHANQLLKILHYIAKRTSEYL